MEWFSSVEFYILAITCAVFIVGLVFDPPMAEKAFTYIYRAIVNSREENLIEDEEDEIIISSDSEGRAVVRHKGVRIPEGIDINIVVDVQGNKVKIIEKFAEEPQENEMRMAEISCILECVKRSKYHIRYECEYSGLWTTITFINRDNFIVKGKMKY